MAAVMHHGIIKSVVSGDTIVLMGADASKGPPPEKLLSLTGIAAPRMGNKSSADEPFAWAAREFLRKEGVGKRVTFQVEAQQAAGNRAFGMVYMEDGQSLASLLVTAGWAKPRRGGEDGLVEAGAPRRPPASACTTAAAATACVTSSGRAPLTPPRSLASQGDAAGGDHRAGANRLDDARHAPPRLLPGHSHALGYTVRGLPPE